MTQGSFFKSLATLVVTAFVAITAHSAQAIDTEQFSVALRGYDAVSYLVDQKAVEGSTEFSTEYKGLTYLFSTAEHEKMFRKTPEKYLPAYNGFCAMGVALGKKLPTDPRAFTVVDGKLYMNLNPAITQKWREDVAGNIATANKNWVELQKTGAAK